jgi:hypothetical protein
MTPREREEYSALRATIGQRGTVRVWIVVAGLAVWSAEAMAAVLLGAPPAMALIPLLFLAATFEAVFALHVGVERIGRYLQVFHESPDDRAAWEATAMRFGQAPRATATDPLFIVCFALATILNFMPVMLAAPLPVEIGVVGAAHLLLLARLFIARGGAARQRAADLARFQEMKHTQP